MRLAVWLILFLCLLPLTGHADPASVLDKAWQALVEESDGVSATSSTATAQFSFWMPNAAKDNSTTASAGQANGPGKPRTQFDVQKEIATHVKGLCPCFAEGVTDTAQAVDPFGLTATATAEWIQLNWVNTGTAYTTFAGYLIYKAPMENRLAAVSNTPQASVSYRDNTTTAKTTYVYQVTAVDAKGQTLVVSWPVKMALEPSQKPLPPTEVSLVTHEERVQLKWTPPLKTSHAIQGYMIYRKEKGYENPECLTNSPVAKAEYYDETGDVGKSYYYQIETVDTRGQTSAGSTTVTGYARPRSRNGLVLMSTAYRGMGRKDTGITADLQFTYYIGTLYGEQAEELSPLPLYLDPISLWLLNADVKYTLLTEEQSPVAIAAGGKGGVLLFAGQQSANSGSFTFSDKSEFNITWGGYAALSRSFGDFGIHGGYLLGSMGDPVYYLSKYMRYGETEKTRNLFYFGIDSPILRRMNMACEVLYPLSAELISQEHPYLINLHVDRLFNFDVSYLHWDHGWGFLGYFNIRFTVFPGSWKQ